MRIYIHIYIPVNRRRMDEIHGSARREELTDQPPALHCLQTYSVLLSSSYSALVYKRYSVQELPCTSVQVLQCISVQEIQCTRDTVYKRYSVQEIQCTRVTVYKSTGAHWTPRTIKRDDPVVLSDGCHQVPRRHQLPSSLKTASGIRQPLTHRCQLLLASGPKAASFPSP
jgi:hypothetical protein